ncbi:MAG: hypothetical protein JW791_02400 [Nanoarchaeota archaeon]|nr:hypothetical protein [Nanoarchaeota archaeon]
MYKIKINREKCKAGVCGGLCSKLCPSNWRILEDNKAHVIRVKVNSLGCNEKAMLACPFKAISISRM